MPDFEQVKAFLEERSGQFAQAVDNSEQFEREFKNLQRYWADEDDEEFMLEETWRVMAKYSPVWAEMTEAGFTPDQQKPSPPPAAPQPQVVKTAEGGAKMEERPLPASSDRLVVWDKAIAAGKEGIAGCMGMLIVVTTLIVAVVALFSADDAETWAATKDVLLILTSLVGVVLGYYFGRVPGEARADKAEGEAKAARTELDQTKGEVRGMLEGGGIDVERGAAPEQMTLTPAQVDRLREMLRR